MVEELLRTLTAELGDLADDLGVATVTVKKWRSGDRTPSAENKRKLAELADRKADRLLVLAGRLRAEAGESSE